MSERVILYLDTTSKINVLKIVATNDTDHPKPGWSYRAVLCDIDWQVVGHTAVPYVVIGGSASPALLHVRSDGSIISMIGTMADLMRDELDLAHGNRYLTGKCTQAKQTIAAIYFEATKNEEPPVYSAA